MLFHNKFAFRLAALLVIIFTILSVHTTVSAQTQCSDERKAVIDAGVKGTAEEDFATILDTYVGCIDPFSVSNAGTPAPFTFGDTRFTIWTEVKELAETVKGAKPARAAVASQGAATAISIFTKGKWQQPIGFSDPNFINFTAKYAMQIDDIIQVSGYYENSPNQFQVFNFTTLGEEWPAYGRKQLSFDDVRAVEVDERGCYNGFLSQNHIRICPAQIDKTISFQLTYVTDDEK